MENETFNLYTFLFTHPIFNLYNAAVIVIGVGISIWFSKVYSRTKSRPLLTSLPGIFTSLGLLGTFMSIVISLHDIKPDDFSTSDDTPTVVEATNDNGSLSAEQQVDAENGVKTAGDIKPSSGTDKTVEIISGLVPAFTSSILGLIMAFIATIWAKKKFAEEDAKLDSKLKELTPEECLYNMQAAARDTYKFLLDQEDKTDKYNKELKENIDSQNNILKEYLKGFQDKMDDIFENVKTDITSQVKTIGTEQLSSAEEVLSKITDSLSEVTKDILKAQKGAVQDLVGETGTHLKNMASSVASQYALIQQNAQENVAMMTSLKEQYTAANTDMLDKAVKMNQEATDDMRESLKGFVGDISESINTECTQLHTQIEANVKALEKSYNFIKDRIAQITADYDQASLAFRDAVTVAHRQNESSENAIKKANDSLELLKQTNKQIEKLLDAFNSRQDNVETLVSHIHEMSSAIESLQKLESQLKRLNK